MRPVENVSLVHVFCARRASGITCSIPPLYGCLRARLEGSPYQHRSYVEGFEIDPHADWFAAGAVPSEDNTVVVGMRQDEYIRQLQVLQDINEKGGGSSIFHRSVLLATRADRRCRVVNIALLAG